MALKGVAGGVGGTIGGQVIGGTAGSILGVGPGALLAETGQSMTSDAAATSMLLKSFNAYPQAATNTSGANTILAGGIGRRIVTVVDYSLIDAGVDTITLTINGTANVGTEGTQDATHWKAETSNAVTAANIATWASQLTGVSATSSGDVAYITADVGTYSVTLATSMAAGEGTVTSGTDGGISLQGTDVFVTRYDAKQLMISGDGVGATTNAGWVLGYFGSGSKSGLWSSTVTINASQFSLAQDSGGDTTLNSLGDGLLTIAGAEKARWKATAGAGISITAGTAADNTPRALSISQTWTDGTTSNIGIVGNFDMGATGTATGKLLSLQAGAAGTTEVLSVSSVGVLTTEYVVATNQGLYSRANGVIGVSFGASDDANITRIAAGVLGVGTGAAGSFAGTIKANAGQFADANGQILAVQSLTELTTIAAAATTDTTIQMPAGAVILGVDVRVTVVIPTAATFTVGDSGSAARFSTAAVSSAANSTDAGTKAGAYYNASALAIRITPNAQPADNSGRVRVTIHYYVVTPATS